MGQLAAAFCPAMLQAGGTGFLQSPDKAIQQIYGNIFADSQRRYAGWVLSENEARDGKRRTVKIEVRGHPEYVSRSQ